MTRDEAIEVVDGFEPFQLPTRREQNVMLVDKLVALGLLKLEEPKSAIHVKEHATAIVATYMGFLTADKVIAALERAGLSIVEAKGGGE